MTLSKKCTALLLIAAFSFCSSAFATSSAVNDPAKRIDSTKPAQSSKLVTHKGKPYSPPSTMGDAIVLVPGSPDCDGVFSDYCGWEGWGGLPSDGGGGSGGGVGSGGGGSGEAAYNDGTTGKSLTYNRVEPGCYREQILMEEVISNAGAGSPPGIVIMESFGDPLYQAPGWQKIQLDRPSQKWTISTGVWIEWRVQIHYMYNRFTREVQQVKMKNSYEYGCVGFVKA